MLTVIGGRAVFEDSTTLRIEGEISRQEALALARSMR